MKLFVATKGIIANSEGKILLLQEKASPDGTHAGKCTLPGGRIHEDESYRDGLVREVQEECGLEVTIGDIIAVGEWWPQPRGEEWHVVALFFACTLFGDNSITLSNEHDAYEWIDPTQYRETGLLETEHHVIEKYLEHTSKMQHKSK